MWSFIFHSPIYQRKNDEKLYVQTIAILGLINALIPMVLVDKLSNNLMPRHGHVHSEDSIHHLPSMCVTRPNSTWLIRISSTKL